MMNRPVLTTCLPSEVAGRSSLLLPPPPHERRQPARRRRTRNCHRQPCEPQPLHCSLRSRCLFLFVLALSALRSLDCGNAFVLLGSSPASFVRHSDAVRHPGVGRRLTAAATVRTGPASALLPRLRAQSSSPPDELGYDGDRGGGGGSGVGAEDDGDAAAAASTQEMLDRTRRQLEAMMTKGRRRPPVAPLDSRKEGGNVDPFRAEREQLCRDYVMKPAHQLQAECRTRGLLSKGRKPDVAERLARNDLYVKYGSSASTESSLSASTGTMDDVDDWEQDEPEALSGRSSSQVVVTRFGPLTLSPVASIRLSNAGFSRPTPIQSAALPVLTQRGSNAILHSETGSGKTLAYLLPFTERLWKHDESGPGVAFVLTPTRELAIQVAKIAASVCPPGTVRLVSHPTHLIRPERVAGIVEEEDVSSSASTRLYVGSATSMAKSLFGSSELPAPPTPKPLAIQLLQNCRYVVLDEVDRLLLGSGGALGVSTNKRKKSRKNSGRDGPDFGPQQAQQQSRHVHEKPAAVVAAAIMRHSLGKAQVVAASATVGRPLRRELARVIGLTPEECPPVVRGGDIEADGKSGSDPVAAVSASEASTRAVTIPESVQHYVYEVKSKEAVTSGALLAATYQVIQRLPNTSKTLVVLTRGFGISTQNAVGALAHFGCEPKPQSLMDSLQRMDPKVPPPFPTTSGRDNEMDVGGDDDEAHESRPPPSPAQADVDPSSSDSDGGYLLVTGEDTVRGLDLDGLDVVLVVGRPNGVDEYTHIAGRTGRAGRSGIALSVVESAAPFLSWETMLRCQFHVLATPDDVRSIEVSK